MGFLIFVLLAAVAPLLLLWVFIAWDRRRMESPVSRERMEAGFSPQGPSQRSVVLGLAATCVIWGVYEWNFPSLPPFSGKHVWLKEIAYQEFGPHGLACLFWVMAVVLCACALVSKRRGK